MTYFYLVLLFLNPDGSIKGEPWVEAIPSQAQCELWREDIRERLTNKGEKFTIQCMTEKEFSEFQYHVNRR